MTVAVPSLRTVFTGLGLLLGAVVLVVVGIRLGSSLLSPSAVMSVAADGELHQVQLLGGVTYLGAIVSDEDGALRLGRPAMVREEPLASPAPDGSTTQIVVQSLATEPFGIAADVIIPLDQVTLVGVVESGSGMAQAYAQAMGATPNETPTP